MRTVIAFMMVLLWAGQVSAETCPDFYRFVDFGQTTKDGELVRGGSVFRAEDFSGASLLNEDRTQCRSVRQMSVDGHGNPIPVVKSINYDIEKTTLNLMELSLADVIDSNAAAEENTNLHRERLAQAKAQVTRGSNFLCVADDSDALSCQVTSPYKNNYALAVYCDGSQCRMPVMAIDDAIIATAAWKRNTAPASAETTAQQALKNVEEIRAFLTPLSSLNPG